ncbi:sigma-70 family RNA polymerase sigma factor [Streptomyces sp. NPDC002540]
MSLYEQRSPGSPGKPGRKLGPIADSVGSTHRAWLEPLRTGFRNSGLTIGELSARTGWAKSKISELLRGTGLYPRWEITYGLLRELRIPAWPMLRLWTAAALEAQKKPDWITRCVDRRVLSTGVAPPLEHQAFCELQRGAYEAYAGVFLDDPVQAPQEAFDILWLRWDEVLASPNFVEFAWAVFRRSVMARTRHVDGYPEFTMAAFDTVALSTARTDEERFAQIEESIALYRLMSRLPERQLDVMVLHHLRGMPVLAVADVLGVPAPSVRSDQRHARHLLETALRSDDNSEGNPRDNH